MIDFIFAYQHVFEIVLKMAFAILLGILLLNNLGK
jgi:hypothetical protein